MERGSSRAFAIVGTIGGVVLTVLLLFWIAAHRMPGRARLEEMRAGTMLAAAQTALPRADVWLGMSLQPLTALMRQRLPLLPKAGVIVADVRPQGPAAAAGFLAGDVLVRLGETDLRKPADALKVLKDLSPGERITAKLWRRGRSLSLELEAATPPPPRVRPPLPLPEAEVEVEAAWLGLDLVAITPKDVQEQRLSPGTRGLLVDDVAAGRAVDAGLAVGDVILAINGRPTRTIKELEDASENAAGALVDILRAGHHLYVSIPPPGATIAEQQRLARRVGLTNVGWDGWPVWSAPPPGWAAPPAYRQVNADPRLLWGQPMGNLSRAPVAQLWGEDWRWGMPAPGWATPPGYRQVNADPRLLWGQQRGNLRPAPGPQAWGEDWRWGNPALGRGDERFAPWAGR